MRTLILCLTLWVAACARRGPEADRDADAIGSVGSAISLERTPCLGRCPVYTVSVSPSGAVTFQGRANVRLLGTATGQIPREQVEELLVELERAGYFDFASRYAMSEPACGRYVTDLPSAISSATIRGRTKRIEHDHGCGGAPGALAVLEKRIDEVLGSERWVGSKK